MLPNSLMTAVNNQEFTVHFHKMSYSLARSADCYNFAAFIGHLYREMVVLAKEQAEKEQAEKERESKSVRAADAALREAELAFYEKCVLASLSTIGNDRYVMAPLAANRAHESVEYRRKFIANYQNQKAPD